MITQFINVLSTLFVINTTSTNTYSFPNSSTNNFSNHNSSHQNTSKFSNLLNSSTSSTSSCPSITPMIHFNTTEYIRSSWYVQQQQVNGYQSNNTLYCVIQTLDATNRTVPFYSGNVLAVYNYANIDRVNGEQQNSMNFTLCARQFNQSMPSELLNAPCILPNYFAGPYWVLATGPSYDNYSWAIISGGQPTVRYPDGNCSTSEEGVNDSGLWLFTRERFGSHVDAYVFHMRNLLLELGYTVSRLLNVSQVGCNYTDTYIKY
jgi:apolipoprotein D and lipocalin family protein